MRSKHVCLGIMLLLGGCCSFMPCHPATYIAGVVMDGDSHKPISNASVHLYYYQTDSTASGCFALGGADAIPFEFRVSAPDYKSVVSKAVPGSYQATVKLVPAASVGTSTSTTTEISREQYTKLSQDCLKK